MGAMTSTDDASDHTGDDARDDEPDNDNPDNALDDGSYDTFVVWADEHADGDISLELTVTAGEHKGDVVSVRASGMWGRDALDLVGLPCTLVVDRGRPHVELDA
jgi:hypothetical protein